MTKTHSDNYFLGMLSLWVVLAILGSICFLDREIAVAAMRLLRSNHLLHAATAEIPDTLFYLVCIGTATMWLAYIYLSRNNGGEKLLCFLQLAASTVPAAYLFKALLQFAFGRTNTRLWLTSGMPLQFNWFHGAGIGCFPSGHMAVFTAFCVAIWYVYPCYRRPTVIGLVLLGMALILTDYHFLSDVIAGAYVGFLVTYGIRHALKRCGARFWASQ
jgi:membrane-associated phospholipid phosphatase